MAGNAGDYADLTVEWFECELGARRDVRADADKRWSSIACHASISAISGIIILWTIAEKFLMALF